MGKKTKLAIISACVLLMVTVGATFAQDGEPGPCGGTSVSGTVVAVDGLTVTIDTGTVLCTVTLGEGAYAHPIVSLLGMYFDDVNAETLVAALGQVSRYVVFDEVNGVWIWAEEGDPDAVAARVVAVVDNGDGTFTIELVVEGQTDPVFLITDDGPLADDLSSAVETLMVTWNLNEDGTVQESGDQIAMYHDEGMGFGVLVKLFAMAEESQDSCAGVETTMDEVCGVTAEELVTAFQSGVGMGELFKIYGKPSILGVGHVRKLVKEAGNQLEDGTLTTVSGDQEQIKDRDRDQDRERDRDRDREGKPDSPGQLKKDPNQAKVKEKEGPPDWAKKPTH